MLVSVKLTTINSNILGLSLLLNVFLILIGVVFVVYAMRKINLSKSQLLKVNRHANFCIEHISDGVISVNETGTVDFINPAAVDLLQIDAQVANGKNINDILLLFNESHERLSINFLTSRDSILERKRQCIMHDVYGNNIFVDLQTTVFTDFDQKNILGYVITIRNISIERQASLALEIQSHTDLLTGLNNRYCFENHVQSILDNAGKQLPYSILFIGLDHFKKLNDSCGQRTGDAFLKKVASLFAHNIRGTDFLARVGGDEFAVLLQNCDTAEAARIANILIEAMATFRFAWQGKPFTIGASIGVSHFYPHNDTHVEDILRIAETACLSAKNMGRNSYYISDIDEINPVKQAI